MATKTKPKTAARPAPMTEAPKAQLPAEIKNSPPAPQSAAERQREKIASRMNAIETHMGDILPFLKDSRVPVDLFLAGCRRAFIRDPKLVDATAASFLQAVMDCARVGLLPDGKKAAIVPFKDRTTNTVTATLIIMYKGFLDVIYRAGHIENIHAQVIYEGEDDPKYLTYDLGSNPYITFQPPLDRDDRKPIIGAFAHAHPKGGGTPWVELMGSQELKKVGAVNKAANGPGKDWPGEMARKAPLRRMAKFLPESPEINLLLEIDDKSYLEKPPVEAASPKAIPDNALFGDHAYVPQAALEHDDASDADHELIDKMVGTQVDEEAAADHHPTAAMEDMLRSAAVHNDPEILKGRLEMVKGVDYGWRDLAPEDKARVNLLYEELLADMNKPLKPPKATGAVIRTAAGAEVLELEQWTASMLKAMNDPRRVSVLNFWSKNLETVEEVCKRAPAAAGPVVAKAIVLDLKRATELVDRYGPFHG